MDEFLKGGVGIDSRKAATGQLFFALKGEKVDGHDFLGEVAARGAAAAVVALDYAGSDFGMKLIRVDDVLASLQWLAKEVLAQRGTRVVGVTGSVGKTTTKEFIATLLAGRYRVGKSPGNSNSQVGVPLSILNSRGEEEVLVLEMGMSGAGEIAKLVQIAPPEVALITKIGLAHSEFFPTGIEGIKAAKAEIFSHPQTRIGIVPKESYSQGQKTFALGDVSADYGLCGDRIFEEGKEVYGVHLPFTASHLRENFLSAAAVARNLGMSWEEIGERTHLLKVFPMRFEKRERNGVVYINDAYNANPLSMRAALMNLPKPMEGGRTIAVLGEMKELGPFSKPSHQEIGKLALQVVDQLICLGKECEPMVELFQEAGRPVEHFLEIEALREHLAAVIREGDVVLLKGSNSNGLWRLLG